MSKVTDVDVARELGMKVDEIASIDDSPAGLIVSFTAGNAPMVKVPEHQPDVEGKTGWMLLSVPPMKAGKVYQGTFPVYAQPVAVAAADGTSDGEYPGDGSIADVLAWVAGDGARAQEALDVEASAKKPRKSLLGELEAIIEQAAAAQTGDAVEFERRGIEVPEGHTGVLNDDGTASILDADGNVVAAYDVDGNLIETV